MFLWFLLVANLDYGRLNMARLTFPPCRRKACIDIHIYDDDRVERQREQFYIALHPYPDSPAGLRVNSRSTINILGNDGMQSEDTTKLMINLMVCVLIPSEIYVGLEKTVQNIQENARSVSQVCVFLFNRATDTSITNRHCPVEFRFRVGVESSPGTAGIVK